MLIKNIPLPDIGDFDAVEVIEILVKVGDKVSADSSLLTLESDKAAMEIPAPEAGVVHELLVDVGDHIATGDIIMRFSGVEEASPENNSPAEVEELEELPPSKAQAPETSLAANVKQPPPEPLVIDNSLTHRAHAGPAVRHFARDLGVDLNKIKGSGRKDRILLEDVQTYVKQQLNKPKAECHSSGLQIGDAPTIDFSEYGEIEEQAFSRIQKISSTTLHRNWVTIPHVTQFDQADISELETFRKGLKAQAETQGLKLTLMPILIKAVVAALKAFPMLNASLNPKADGIILKKYMHIGFAVDTPDGLLVPVIRNADQLGLFDLAKELARLSEKAREGKLSPKDMQGGCFTISSLGGIGGTAFTPIINAPELAILGVSRSQTKPVFIDGEFKPRLMLPLSLSYDHRAIDGALAVRFTAYLSFILADVRRLLL